MVVIGGVLLWPETANDKGKKPETPAKPSVEDTSPPAEPLAQPEPKPTEQEEPDTETAKEEEVPPAPLPAPTSNPASPEAVRRAETQVEKGKAAEGAGNLLAAREPYRLALEQGLPPKARRNVHERLYDIAAKTIFSRARVPEDPLTRTHVVASGENLQVIAKKHRVTAPLLAKINGIRNPNLIRAGQGLKVVNGPFHAVIDKSDFTMRIYLQDVPVSEYRVGLGADNGTPTGKWRIKAGSKLKNPTFYPPASYGGPVIAADDPKNPLGERWLGLEGIEGEAVGQEQYGIHGTIEPESIGKSGSLGCIRMLNEDVAEVFDTLVPVHSIVTVQP